VDFVVWPFITISSYWVAHYLAQKITKITKSLKIVTCLPLIVFILRSYVDELKLYINSEWAAVSHAVIEHAVGELHRRLPLVFVLEDILSTCCDKDDVMRHVTF